MTADIEKVKSWEFYCDGCDMHFSVPADRERRVSYCPVCGWDALERIPPRNEEVTV